jgi:hypothetical protein
MSTGRRVQRLEYSKKVFVVADTGTVGGDNTLTSEVARLLQSKAPSLVTVSQSEPSIGNSIFFESLGARSVIGQEAVAPERFLAWIPLAC